MAIERRCLTIRPIRIHVYSIEDRMKQLGRMDRYQKELSKLIRPENIPSDWATPDQRCRAAIKAVGQYGQVIALNRTRKPKRTEGHN